jgi:uncharacterized membrane protein YjjB (DUF3815 family)
MTIQIVSALFAIMAASIYLEIPKRFIFRAGFVGALGWGVYLIFGDIYGIVLATYIAGIVVSITSHIISRRVKTPVTIFFIPGLYPLVPGYRLYMAVFSFMSGNGPLATSYLVDTIKISGMIALAIFTADALFHIINKVKKIIPQN